MKQLKSAKCARNLRKVEFRNVTEESVEVMSRCCPNIVEISLHEITRRDVKAMANLKHLEVLQLRFGNEEEEEEAMGETEGVESLKRIQNYNVRFNLTRFFFHQKDAVNFKKSNCITVKFQKKQ